MMNSVSVYNLSVQDSESHLQQLLRVSECVVKGCHSLLVTAVCCLHTHTHTYAHTRSGLTCADSDRLHKLLSPGVCADHQRQVGLFNELVNGALPITSTKHTSLAANYSGGQVTETLR